MDTTTLKPYLKKDVAFTISGQRLEFAVSQTLFSSHQVDIGSAHLLKTLPFDRIRDNARILDLGCGYGPLGLTLAWLKPTAEVHMVDRDALAVDFTLLNAHRLGVSNAVAYGSLGYNDVRSRTFDLIISNIPGKAGGAVIRALVLDARHHLSGAGMAAIVVVRPLEQIVLDLLTDPSVEIVLQQTTAAHAVFHYRFVTGPSDSEGADGSDQSIYDRGEIFFPLEGLAVPLRTAYGLPEFDTLSFETELLLKAYQDLGEIHPLQAVIFNPRQGHLAVALWRLFRPTAIDLVDRDLLSLRYARENLIRGGCPAGAIGLHHQTELVPAGAEPDLVVGLVREDEGPDAVEATVAQAGKQLVRGGSMLIAGGSTPITRILKSRAIGTYLRAGKRRRSKGNSSTLFQRV